MTMIFLFLQTLNNFNISKKDDENDLHGNEPIYVSFATISSKKEIHQNKFIYYGQKNENQIKFKYQDGGKEVLSMVWKDSDPGPGAAVSIESFERFSYGHFSASFKSPDTSDQPNAGVISSFYLLFNDHKHRLDQDGDGIRDTSEIDFEFLGASPSEVHLTAHIDYEDNENRESTTRIIDLKDGREIECFHIKVKNGEKTKTPLTNQPSVPKIPGYKNTDYHTFGIDYFKNKLTLWIDINGVKTSLFELSKGYIPLYPMYILGNIWWTDNWTPSGIINEDAIEKPKNEPSVNYEWIKWEPCTTEEDQLYNQDQNINEISSPKKSSKVGLIVGIIVPIVVVVVIVVVVLIVFKRKHVSNEENSTISF